MADTQFSPLGTVAAPANWTLPPSLEIVVKAAFATFDGTGASGDFLPTLEIISDSGHVVGVYTTDTAVLAGNSAEVSFFPFSPGSTATPAGAAFYQFVDDHGTIVTQEQVLGFYGAGVTITDVPGLLETRVTIAGSTPLTDYERIAAANVTTITAGNQASLDWSGGSQTGTSLLDLTAPTLPKIITAGIYAFTVWVGTQASNVQAGKEVISTMSLAIAGVDLQAAVPYVGATGGSAARMTLNGTCYFAANETVSVQVSNADTINHDFRIVLATVQHIS